MPRVLVAEGCREVDSPSGVRYYARGGRKGYEQGGVFEMSDGDAKLAQGMGGAIASLAGTTRSGFGFRCISCGFGSFIRQCGRCGAVCVREGGEQAEQPVEDVPAAAVGSSPRPAPDGGGS